MQESGYWYAGYFAIGLAAYFSLFSGDYSWVVFYILLAMIYLHNATVTERRES